MSTRKSITAFPPIPLDKADTQNCKPARSDIPRRLSASAAWLAGYIVGGDELEAGVTPNLAPRSPMHGLRGHTHSGGLDGRPLFRTIATFSMDPADLLSANIVGENDGEWTTKWPNSTITASTETTVPIGNPIPLFVPGCDPVNGAYRRLGWHINFRVLAATSPQAGDTVSIIIKNNTTETTAETESAAGQPTVTTPAYWTAVNGTALDSRLFCQPGVVNVLEFSVKYTADGTAATRNDVSLGIMEMEFGVFSD